MFVILQNVMRGNVYNAIVILCLPLEIICYGLKLEGLIDLGPKWDYMYNLTPIRDILNENEKATFKNGLNKIIKNKNLDGYELNLNTDRFLDASFDNKQVYDLHNVRHKIHASPDYNNNIGMQKGNVKEDISDSTKEDSEELNNKYTKQYLALRNTQWLDDVNNGRINSDNDNKNKMIALTTQSEVNNIEINKLHANGNLSNSRMRIKSKLTERKIKDNSKIKNFTIHIFNESLQIFDKIKNLTDIERFKRKLEALKECYIEKFGKFLKKIDEHKLKTKLADQNVIFHTIDVNNSILKRIINYITDGQTGHNGQTRISGILNVFKNEVEKEKTIETRHACTKLSICRSDEEFSDFIISILDIILVTDNRKLKQASDAITEAVKANDLTNIIDNETQSKLRKLMDNMESWDPFLTRSMFLILRNVLAYKNLPIVIMHASELSAVNNTMNIHQLIDILNRNMGTVVNKNEWKDIKKQIEEWKDGKRNDVQKAIDLIIRQIISVLEKVDNETRNAVNTIIKELLSRRRNVM